MIVSDQRILVTGATGYIGGRLVPRLLAEGYSVRCAVRSARKLSSRAWVDDPRVEIVEADVANTDRLADAIDGCAMGYYLVHSMLVAGDEYRDRDQQLARSFSQAAQRAGLQRIAYLGGLGETGENLSEHLASRREVEKALASAGVPVTTLRAAMIIGSGSASFEILRYLVERLPIMITPKWVKTECQPIAVRDVLGYLVDCLRVPETVGRAIDVGGADVMTYKQLMQEMTRALKLPRRIILPVPVLTPRLSSAWIHLVTPLSHRIARPLAEGLKNRVVVRNDDAQRLMPRELFTVREAIEAAAGKTDAHDIETRWSDAGALPGDPDWAGGTTFVDSRSREVAAGKSAVYKAVCRIGGGQGYYAADWLWRVRGWMDQVVGGPGLRRGRRNPETVSVGEALDFWRVTSATPDEHLRLRAEMKLPGIATLEFQIDDRSDDACVLVQTARFKPKGLFGLLYWYAVLPLHHIVFNGMLRGIARAAEVTDGKAVSASARA